VAVGEGRGGEEEEASALRFRRENDFSMGEEEKPFEIDIKSDPIKSAPAPPRSSLTVSRSTAVKARLKGKDSVLSLIGCKLRCERKTSEIVL